MSDDHHAAPIAVPKEPFTGGTTAMAASAAIGAIGLLLTLAGAFASPRDTAFSYLFAFSYWCGIAVGALLLVQIWHASNARWPVAVRRLVETLAVAAPLFALLFIPVVLGMHHTFVWLDPHALSHEDALNVAHKAAYLNQTAFIVRGVIYFAVWIVVAHLLRAWSLLQDESGDPALTIRQRRLGAGALPINALCISFAAFDWLMSLDPVYGSTIWGLYYFAGSFLGAIALTILFTHSLRDRGALGQAVSIEHLHSLGMFLFAWTCFWAYMAYSQGMLNWIANLPHETRFYLARSRNGWKGVGIALILAHFIFPFFLLIGRKIKRTPKALAAAAVYVLLAHALDLYWVVLPASGRPAAPHWTVFTAFLGVGGASIAFTLFRLRGQPLVALGDPYLDQSLRYQQP